MRVTVVFPTVLLCLTAVPMRERTSSDAFGVLGLIPRLENHRENCPAGRETPSPLRSTR